MWKRSLFFNKEYLNINGGFLKIEVIKLRNQEKYKIKINRENLCIYGEIILFTHIQDAKLGALNIAKDMLKKGLSEIEYYNTYMSKKEEKNVGI